MFLLYPDISYIAVELTAATKLMLRTPANGRGLELARWTTYLHVHPLSAVHTNHQISSCTVCRSWCVGQSCFWVV